MKLDAKVNYESAPLGVLIKTVLLVLFIFLMIFLSPFLISAQLPSADLKVKTIFILAFCGYMLYVLIPLSKTIIPAIIALLKGKSSVTITEDDIAVERGGHVKKYPWQTVGKVQREIFLNENYIVIFIGWPLEILIEDDMDWTIFQDISKYVSPTKIAVKIKNDKITKADKC